MPCSRFYSSSLRYCFAFTKAPRHRQIFHCAPEAASAVRERRATHQTGSYQTWIPVRRSIVSLRAAVCPALRRSQKSLFTTRKWLLTTSTSLGLGAMPSWAPTKAVSVTYEERKGWILIIVPYQSIAFKIRQIVWMVHSMSVSYLQEGLCLRRIGGGGWERLWERERGAEALSCPHHFNVIFETETM